MTPELVQEFVRAYHAELNQQRSHTGVRYADKRRELESVSRKLDGLIDAMADGFRAPGLQQRLDELTERKAELEAELAQQEAPLPRLHPRLADVYRQKVECLHEALQSEATRQEAIQILQQLIDKVTVRWCNGAAEIEFVGEIANMVALSVGRGGTAGEQFRRSVTVVAGEGYTRNSARYVITC
jgi:site-specific DNA recombinase